MLQVVTMRINIWGSPGVGKSTIACKIFSHLKADGYNIELVLEYIKKWTYIDRMPQGFDQYYISAKQMHREYIALSAGFDHIVTDCPVLLNCFYAEYCNLSFSKSLIDIALEFEKKYPSFNIFVKRHNRRHSDIARFHNEKESLEIDAKLKQFVEKYNFFPIIEWDLTNEKNFEERYWKIKYRLER